MLNHIDQEGRPQMVNILDKKITSRRAIARTLIHLPECLGQMITNHDIITPKGSIVQSAIIAGTMAVKKTSELIPFCHPLGIEGCSIRVEFLSKHEIAIECEVTTSGKTGVEMEALTGSSLAALCIYDMCKFASSEIKIISTELVLKTGGKKPWLGRPLKGLVLTGGQSTRMGEPKALISYSQKPQAIEIFEVLKNYCDEVYLSGKKYQWQGTPLEKYPQVIDELELSSPINGIYSALHSDPNALWLVVACDVVHFQSHHVDKLLSQYDPKLAGIFFTHSDQGFPEALAGIYDGHLQHEIKEAIDRGVTCPVKFVKQLKVKLVDQMGVTPIDNINTPDEREKFLYANH